MMPDFYIGTGCVIGTVMTIQDKIVPNLVGVYIGCGVSYSNLGKINLYLKK
nr:RtcB family protein [Clostridioides difficile]